MSDCWVYIIGHTGDAGPEGPVKIGLTKSPVARLAQIQTGNWRRVEITHSFRLSSETLARLIEYRCHDVLSEFRMSGEWFSVDPMVALENLTCVVFDIIGERLSGNAMAAEIDRSGARDHLNAVTTWWGMPE